MKVKTASGEVITLDKKQIKGDPNLYGVDSKSFKVDVLPKDIVEILEVTFWELLKGWVSQLFKLIFK